MRRKTIANPLSRNEKKNGSVVYPVLVCFAVVSFLGAAVVYSMTIPSLLDGASKEERTNGFLRSSANQLQQHNNSTLVVDTGTHGQLRIVLRPDLSPESVDYIRQLATSDACTPCNLYRAETPGILQGILASPHLAVPTSKGRCPDAAAAAVPNHCPAWDAECGCHGPVMTRGMVGWAAGKTGPDFFIDGYPRPAKWWGTQHTVWGELQDAASFATLDTIFRLPVREKGGLKYLVEPIHIELVIEEEKR